MNQENPANETMAVQVNDIFDNIIEQLTGPDVILLILGSILLIKWLANTNFGKNALTDAPEKRNSLKPIIAFIPLIVWIVIPAVGGLVFHILKTEPSQQQETVVFYFLGIIGGLAAIAVTIIIANKYFARGIKGFGLKSKTIGKDFAYAVVYLVSLNPIILIILLITALIGYLLQGSDFQIQTHESLETLAQFDDPLLRVLIVILAVVIAPLIEEMLFRGMFQTTLKSYLRRPWVAIFIASALFAVIHPIGIHWPVLFALSVVMGYSYEKSGSLWQPIFIHALFNAAAVISTIMRAA